MAEIGPFLEIWCASWIWFVFDILGLPSFGRDTLADDDDGYDVRAPNDGGQLADSDFSRQTHMFIW